MQKKIYITISTIILTLCFICSPSNSKESKEIHQEVTISPESEVSHSSPEIITTSDSETSDISSVNSDQYIQYETSNGGGAFKSYTNYKLLNKESSQWNKIQCHNNAYTDENGLRKIDEYYCVAMGSYYTKTLGDLFEIKTESGMFAVIICDFKADKHTDVKNQYTLRNGCMVEFYVDINTLNNTAKHMGDISYVSDNFKGKIISITKLGNYFETKEGDTDEGKS